MITTIQKWFFEPSQKIKKAEDRRQARLLSVLLLVTILAVLAEQVVAGNVPRWFLVILLIGYILSRTVYFRVAAAVCILLLALPSFLVAIRLPEPSSLRMGATFMWLIIPVLLSSAFLSIRQTAVIIGLYILGAIALPFLNPAISWSMIWGTLGFVITTGLILLIVMAQRDLIEKDRQTELAHNNMTLKQEVSVRQETEIALRHNEESARYFQHQLIALQEVSIELTKTPSFDDLCRSAIILGRSQLKFDRLGIWFIAEDDPYFMVGSFGIDEMGNLRDEREQRLPVWPADVLDPDRLSDMKMRAWRRNVLFNSEHDVVGEGWNIIAPLWRDDKVMGFISADNLLEKRPFSQELLELLGLYATTLSHLIVRKQEEVRSQNRREMLEKVVEQGKHVTQVADLRECLLRIYTSIKEGLDFDRVGIFLYDAENHLLLGTYGTDREGNFREEWDIKLSAAELAPSGMPLHMAQRVVFARDFEQTYGKGAKDQASEMEGVNQHLRVISWLGDQPIAVINVDNLVTQRAITEEQVEALHLFAGYAGLAIENARLLAQYQEAEQRYRSIFENAMEGIFQVAPEGYFLESNPALAQMLGYDTPAELLIGISDIATQIYIDPARRLELRRQLTQYGRAENFEFEVKRRDSSRAWLSQNVQAVYDDQHEMVYFEGTAQDVTDRKQAEEDRELLIQELERRNEELERFTYTVSHDLKSPLITIRGFLGFIERDALAGDTARLKTDIAYITNATTRMQQLLDELLELSRVGRLVNPSEIVPFAELVEEALSLVSGRLLENQVQVTVAEAMPDVFVDRHRVVEVLQNLLDNAAKFMGAQATPCVAVGVEMIDAETCFFVRDNGIGIDLAYQETVFGLFERLDQSIDGTGIGLALVKRIIEVHNGRLWVESAGKEQGSTFYFTLPLADEVTRGA